MTAPRHIRVSGPQPPSVKEVYMPHWARLRRLAAFERFAGHQVAHFELSKMARHVRNEMTEADR